MPPLPSPSTRIGLSTNVTLLKPSYHGMVLDSVKGEKWFSTYTKLGENVSVEGSTSGMEAMGMYALNLEILKRIR